MVKKAMPSACVTWQAHVLFDACDAMQVPSKGVEGKAYSLVEVVTEAYG